MSKGERWGGVSLEMRALNGEILWQGQSDENGLAHAPGLASLPQANLTARDIFVVAHAQGQMALWNLAWNSGFEPWRFNMNYAHLGQSPPQSHWLLSALPLYRPGDTAKLKIIARENDGGDLVDLGEQTFDIKISDGRGQTVITDTVTTNSLGTATYELPIETNGALGQWDVSLGPGPSSMNYIGSFRVLTYRAPAFDITINNLPHEAIVGEKVDIQAQALYHFGTAVKGQPFKYDVTSQRTYINLGALGQYNLTSNFTPNDDYGDFDEGYHEPFRAISSGVGQLSANGEMQVALDLTPPLGFRPSPRKYTTSITVEDVDRRTVSKTVDFVVHPASLYVGILSENYLAQKNEPLTVKLVAADLNGQLVAGQKITVDLYRRTWQSVRRKSPSAIYEYVSRARDHKVSTFEGVTGALPLEMSFIPEQAGYYVAVAEIKDSSGRLNQASVDFYALGDDVVGWRMANNNQVTMVSDKQQYAPGDMAQIMVQSPFDKGEGLLTVERDGVRSSHVFAIENNTPAFDIPIGEEDAPNIFVSVLLTQGRRGETISEGGLDLGKPQVKMGYMELLVPTHKNRLSVLVQPSHKEVGPGDEIDITVEVKDYQGQAASLAEVALIVAEAQVMQVAGDSTYYPEQVYHRNLPLMVHTTDNVLSLIGRRDWTLKGGNPGGGGGDFFGETGANTIRQKFESLAFFAPQVLLDENGQAKVTVTMPENLTTFKIYAVATGKGRLTGTGTETVLVTRDILVRGALPPYAGVGDEFYAATVVTNRQETPATVTVALSGTGFTLLQDQSTQTVTVGGQESLEVSFKVKALSADRGKFIFMVTGGGKIDGAEFTIPISPPNELTTQAVYERLKPGTFETSLKVSEGFDPSRGGLEIQLSPTLVGVLSEPLAFLAAYPHSCLEQLTSRAYGRLVWLNLKDRFVQTEEAEAEARAQIQTHLNLLAQWSMGGGFNLWPNSHNWGTRSVYLTAFVLDFMLAALEADFVLPHENMLPETVAFLKSALENDDHLSWPQWFSTAAKNESRSYALFMLAKAGENVAALTEKQFQQRNDLSLAELIHLVRTIGYSASDKATNEQINQLLPLFYKHLSVTVGLVAFDESAADAPEIWSSPIRTSAMALMAILEVAPHHDLLPHMVRYLVGVTRDGHFSTTQNNIFAIKALAQYVKVAEPNNLNLTVTAAWQDKPLGHGQFTSFTDLPINGNLAAEELVAGPSTITYELEGEGAAWATMRLKTAPLSPDLTAANLGGFMLSRSFEVLAPSPGPQGAQSFKRGEIVKITVTMMVPKPRHGVVLLDRVPAGFEPINFNLNDADQSLLALSGGTSGWPLESRWYNHQEIWPDKVAVYGDYLPQGVYTFSYLARAVTVGTYLTPGPSATEMYNPETQGRGAGHQLVVAP
ncbi:MAG: alpha-2-macroglobulin family protein [Candidatus Adiutrix sp.]